MVENINLLPQRKLSAFSEERVLFASKIVAATLVVLVVVLSILFFLLSRDPAISALKKDQSQTLAQLNLLHDRTAKYLIVVDRVTKIKTVLQKRGKLDLELATILQQVPSDVVVTNLTLDTKVFTLAITASNLSRIGMVTDNFVALAKQKKVLKNLTIQGLITDEKAGTYVLTLSADTL